MKSLENYTRVDIKDATEEQLRTFAETVMNIDVDAKDKAEAIKVKMASSGWAMPFVLIPIAIPKHEGSEEKQIQRRQRKDGRYEMRIRIYSTDKPGGADPVPVGVNGSVMLIPRDKDVWVLEEYVLTLANAVEVTWPEYDAGNDFSGGLKDGQRREVQAYPFAFV